MIEEYVNTFLNGPEISGDENSSPGSKVMEAGDDTGADMIVPRQFLDNLEKLARMIHHEYNVKQIEKHPERKPKYPTWESLPDVLKYSNIRQARRIADKLRLIRCIIVPNESEYCQISCFTDNEIEYLAEAEHNFFVVERLSNGWKYGEMINIDKKISPYLVPYDQLDEEIKQLDRDTIINIIPLLESIGLAVHRVRKDKDIYKQQV